MVAQKRKKKKKKLLVGKHLVLLQTLSIDLVSSKRNQLAHFKTAL